MNSHRPTRFSNIFSRVLNTLKTMVTDDEVLEKDDIYILDRVKKFLLDPDVSVAPAAKNLLAAVERKVSLPVFMS